MLVSKETNDEGWPVSVEEISTIAWVAWAALILIFLVIEIFTLDFTFLMLGVASIGGVIAAALGVPWFFQLLIVGVLAVLLIFAVRPPLLRALRKGGDETPSNIEALIGLRGTVSTAFASGQGHVKLSNGDTWTSRVAGSAEDLPLGDTVVVVAIEGATAVVAPLERTN
jgi:membrane protein implicated in regulation of membrane protease activity